MTTIDSVQSVLSELYDTLTEDSTLATTMGGSVVVYPVQGGVDVATPYLIHTLDIAPNDDFWVRQNATYIIDIFSDSTNIAEVLAIRKRIIELLDEKDLETTEAGNIHLWKQTDGWIPEDTGFHYVIQFNIRFYRLAETDVIVAR